MDFQIDQAKLQQAQIGYAAYASAAGIANDRNDVNIYRINTQAELARDRNRGQ